MERKKVKKNKSDFGHKALERIKKKKRVNVYQLCNRIKSYLLVDFFFNNIKIF